MGIGTHLAWFLPGSIITSSDWYYWHDESVSQLWYSSGTWLTYWNTGRQNIQIFFNLFTAAWSVLVAQGLSYDFSVKLTFLIPISILGFISPYFFFRRLTGDNRAAFLAALFYGTTTYFLIRQTAHLPLAFVYAILPLLFLSFQVALERKDTYYWLIFTLLYSIGIGYEIRMTYIFTLMVLLYAVLDSWQNWRAYLAILMVVLPVGVLLNCYWLLPTLFGGTGEAISGTANRGIFGDFLFDIVHAITLHDSSWTGGFPNQDFVKQPVPWYFLVFPMLAIAAFFRTHEKATQKQVLFFASLMVIGIFLTKQAGQPASGAYLWLYENFPGFSLFREASKFYVVTAFGYAGLLAFTLSHLSNVSANLNKPQLSHGAVIIFLILIGWQVKPLVNGDIRTLFVARTIPEDYSLAKTWTKNQDSPFYRTLWIPDYSRWSFYTNEHPIVSAVQELPLWKEIFKNVDKYPASSTPLQISEVLSQSSYNHYLDMLGVRYLAIPLRDVANDDNFFRFYGNSRDYYIRLMDRLAYLKPVDLGTKELKIYENENARPRIYSTEVIEGLGKPVPFKSLDYQMLSPTEYQVTVRNMSSPMFLYFAESYSKNWALRLGSFEWGNLFFAKNYFMDDQLHAKTDIGLNVFRMTPEYIKKELPSSDYVINPDGSLTLKLTIYFKPQSYFYLGVIISSVTLLLALTFLMVRRRPR